MITWAYLWFFLNVLKLIGEVKMPMLELFMAMCADVAIFWAIGYGIANFNKS